jgi:uncharacterized membrane protein
MIGAVLALGYIVASHELTAHAGGSALALLIVLGPIVGVSLSSLWNSGQRSLATAGAALALALMVLVARGNGIAPQWLYLLQHAGIHLALALWFGLTLRPGHQPLISALAERVHGHLIPTMAVYTRQVTQAWVLYFASIATASLGLFFGADFEVWSLLANVITPVLSLSMFAGEYLLRYRLHPEFERVGLLESIKAYRLHQADRAAAVAAAQRSKLL